MIIISIKGGLGNQLFQIFTAISYAIDNEDELLIDESSYFNQDENTTKRNTYWNNILNKLKKKVTMWKKDNKYEFYKEEAFEYKKLPVYSNKIHLSGFFQSPKYFLKNFTQVYNLLDIKAKKEATNKKYKFDYKNLCSIHFRYGDYKKSLDYHCLLTKNYYQKAIEIIISKSGKKNFLVFYEKEDEEEIKNIINFLKESNKKIRSFEFIDTNIPDYDQILIMSACHSNIISNSTYSWWGAYLNDTKDKVIVRPYQWFGPKMAYKNLKDLFPNDWHTIPIKK